MAKKSPVLDSQIADPIRPEPELAGLRQLSKFKVRPAIYSRHKKKNGPGAVEPAPIRPRELTNMVPPRLARKMSVMSVEPPARGAPGGIAA